MPRAHGLSSRPKKKAATSVVATHGNEPGSQISDEFAPLDGAAPTATTSTLELTAESPGKLKQDAAADALNDAMQKAAVLKALEREYLPAHACVPQCPNQPNTHRLTSRSSTRRRTSH